MTQVFIPSGTTWYVPLDFTNSNFIDCIGGGRGGAGGTNNGSGGTGGTGGAFARIWGVNLVPGSTVNIIIGQGTTGTAAGGGAATAGGDTSIQDNFNNIICLAPGGGSATTTIGTVTNIGGAGGVVTAGTDNSGSGGGSAGGFIGVGAAGGTVAATAKGGSGGAGNKTGNVGVASASASTAGTQGGAARDTTAGGTGGAVGANKGNDGSHGSGAGGGGAGSSSNGGAGGVGGNGNDYEATHGFGGGGGGGGGSTTNIGGQGGNGGLYGGGGGGGGAETTASGAGGNGANGIIVIQYYPRVGSADRYREYLGGSVLTAAAASITLTIAPRAMIFIEVMVTSISSADIPALQFNSDSGSNYASRYVSFASGGVVGTNTATPTTTMARLGSNTATTNQSYLIALQNPITKSKAGAVNQYVGTGSSASTSAYVFGGFEWNNSTAPITTVKLLAVAGNNFGIGTTLRITGGDVL